MADLKWTQPTEREDGSTFDPLTELHGNNVYVKGGPGNTPDYDNIFTAIIQPGEEGLEYILPVDKLALTAGTYELVVTALDKTGRESAYSDAIALVIEVKPPKPPTGLLVL